MISPSCVSIEWDGIVVALENIGEGYSGEYDSRDPEDEQLMRIYVSVRCGEELVDYDDGSACTRIPASRSAEKLTEMCILIMRRVFEPVSSSLSIKKIIEELSWLTGNESILPLR